MLTKQKAKKIIKSTVINSITEFAEKSLKKRAKFQILDLIIPKERKIRSIVGGLETSLGTTLWEPLAKALAKENGFTVKNENLQSPINIPANLSNTMQSIVEDRLTNGGLYNATSCHETIKNVCQSFIAKPIENFEDAPRGFGVDIWLIKDGIDYFFDTKTVQPNIGTLSKCMQQVLNWYAYYYSRYPNGSAVARIIFPYNPEPEKLFWDGIIGKGKPLEKVNEAWVENEFWDFCSGLTDTYSLIYDCFVELRKSKELEEIFDNLLNNHE